ncbi:DUF4332 domain-containing protein [Candidatus Thorarchaeota archaeon]|nr:MAG: DUF4332 domain-containing protein [Candidatus Thorarchaeota archaeon]
MKADKPKVITLAVAALSIALIAVYSPTQASIGIIIVSAMIAGICSREKSETTDDTVESYVPEVEESAAELSNLPIETVEGIGSVHGTKLRNEGIGTLEELMRARADEVANICDVSMETSQRWIAMSRFCWMGTVSEEDAEAIVYAGGIMDVTELANADGNGLFRKIDDAIEKGYVRVPDGYEISREKVSLWIHEANSLLK